MAKLESVRGYVLEELLSFLIQNAGYSLLVHRDQDPVELDHRGNGLVVKGRGTVHQADVLGQLAWIPAFTHPIRLFVEAKFRSTKTGLAEVRSAVGVVDDLNQNYHSSSAGAKKALVKRYSYRYAIFSTSGFTANAIDMALAHQISLVDLSGHEFQDLRSLAHDIAAAAIQGQAATLEEDGNEEEETANGRAIRVLRFALRSMLGTWPEQIPISVAGPRYDIMEETIMLFPSLAERWDEFKARVEAMRELFVAMGSGPYMLLLKPADAEAFLRYARRHPSHSVRIRWTNAEGHPESWWIEPSRSPNAYRVHFSLPRALASWVFADPNRAQQRALDLKGAILSDISVYHHNSSRDRDEIFRLRYDVRQARDELHLPENAEERG